MEDRGGDLRLVNGQHPELLTIVYLSVSLLLQTQLRNFKDVDVLKNVVTGVTISC